MLPSKEAQEFYQTAKGKTPIEKLNNCWEDLQANINGLLSNDSRRSKDGIGLKQVSEKNKGLQNIEIEVLMLKF